MEALAEDGGERHGSTFREAKTTAMQKVPLRIHKYKKKETRLNLQTPLHVYFFYWNEILSRTRCKLAALERVFPKARTK